MIVENDKLARVARERIFRNDLGPMAKWLRSLNNLNATILAELIEAQKIVACIPQNEITFIRHLVVGQWIESQCVAGEKVSTAIVEAMDHFGVSKRDAERARTFWSKGTSEDGAPFADFAKALQHLASPPNNQNVGGDIRKRVK